MKKNLLFLFLFICSFVFAQNQHADSVKYINAIKYIQQSKSVSNYRNKYFYKEAKNFKVSQHIIYNYYPLRYLSKYFDSLNLSAALVDSLCAIKKDTLTTVPFAPSLSLNKTSNYVLYVGKPFKNLMLLVIQYNQNNKLKDAKYNGICCRPFIIILNFDKTNQVTKAYCSAPIID